MRIISHGSVSDRGMRKQMKQQSSKTSGSKVVNSDDDDDDGESSKTNHTHSHTYMTCLSRFGRMFRLQYIKFN